MTELKIFISSDDIAVYYEHNKKYRPKHINGIPVEFITESGFYKYDNKKWILS